MHELPFRPHMVIPMSFASRSRGRMSFAGKLCVFVLALCAGSAVLRAQDTLLPDSPSPPAPVHVQSTAPVTAPVDAPTPTPTLTPAPATSGLGPAPNANSSPSSPSINHDPSGSAHGHNAQRKASQGFSLWDRTLFDASQHGSGGRSSHSYAMGGEPAFTRAGLNPWGGEPDDLESLFQRTNTSSFDPGRGSGGAGSGMNGAHGSAPGDLKLDQLTRGNLGMYLKSSVGSFRLSYQDAFGARSNGLGGGVGQGSAGASFNSSTFGNGMFNFSATTMLGSGSTGGSSRGGFSAGSMNGQGHGGPSNPSGAQKQPTASVSLHLHF